MIHNYAGRVVHLRMKNGDLDTLLNNLKLLPIVRPRSQIVGETESGGMALSYHKLQIDNLPPEAACIEGGDLYLVSEAVFWAAKELGRLDCVTLDYTSGRPLRDGPIMGSGYEYSRLRTAWEYEDDPEVEADEPMILAAEPTHGWTSRSATLIRASLEAEAGDQ